MIIQRKSEYLENSFSPNFSNIYNQKYITYLINELKPSDQSNNKSYFPQNSLYIKPLEIEQNSKMVQVESTIALYILLLSTVLAVDLLVNDNITGDQKLSSICILNDQSMVIAWVDYD